MGIDCDLFTSDKDVLSTFECSICTEIAHPPCLFPCTAGHIYCKECIFGVENCPNDREPAHGRIITDVTGPLLRVYNNLKLQCPMHCVWQGSIGNLEIHSSHCPNAQYLSIESPKKDNNNNNNNIYNNTTLFPDPVKPSPQQIEYDPISPSIVSSSIIPQVAPNFFAPNERNSRPKSPQPPPTPDFNSSLPPPRHSRLFKPKKTDNNNNNNNNSNNTAEDSSEEQVEATKKITELTVNLNSYEKKNHDKEAYSTNTPTTTTTTTTTSTSNTNDTLSLRSQNYRALDGKVVWAITSATIYVEGNFNPYIVIRKSGVSGFFTHMIKTNVIKNTRNPVWNFTKKIEGRVEDYHKRGFTLPIVVELWSRHSFPERDELIGRSSWSFSLSHSAPLFVPDSNDKLIAAVIDIDCF